MPRSIFGSETSLPLIFYSMSPCSLSAAHRDAGPHLHVPPWGWLSLLGSSVHLFKTKHKLNMRTDNPCLAVHPTTFCNVRCLPSKSGCQHASGLLLIWAQPTASGLASLRQVAITCRHHPPLSALSSVTF